MKYILLIYSSSPIYGVKFDGNPYLLTWCVLNSVKELKKVYRENIKQDIVNESGFLFTYKWIAFQFVETKGFLITK